MIFMVYASINIAASRKELKKIKKELDETKKHNTALKSQNDSLLILLKKLH
jgi:uncharacterized membrane protein (DUF106 family)